MRNLFLKSEMTRGRKPRKEKVCPKRGSSHAVLVWKKKKVGQRKSAINNRGNSPEKGGIMVGFPAPVPETEHTGL